MTTTFSRPSNIEWREVTGGPMLRGALKIMFTDYIQEDVQWAGQGITEDDNGVYEFTSFRGEAYDFQVHLTLGRPQDYPVGDAL